MLFWINAACKSLAHERLRNRTHRETDVMARNTNGLRAAITVITTVVTCLLSAGVVAAAPDIIKQTPGLRMTELAGRSDTDTVEFSGGRTMRVGDLRRLETLGKRLRASRGTGTGRNLAALRAVPVETKNTRRLSGASDLATALKGGPGDTVKLPSGRVLSVAQIKVLQPYIEKRLGRRIDVAGRPALSGQAESVKSGTDLKKLLLKKDGGLSDSTILESPKGTRITVGELKQFLAGVPRSIPAGQRGNVPPLLPKEPEGGRAK